MADIEEGSRQTGKNGCLALVLTAIILCVLAIILFHHSQRAFFEAVLVGETGPVSSPDQWPKPLKDLLAEAKRANLEIVSVQVHCLCQGFDPEYVWRMEATPGLLEHIKQKWELSQVNEPGQVIRTGQSRISGKQAPLWWSPMKCKNCEFYVCKRTLEREKSDRFQVALDRDGQVIFVHYWFNF